MRNTIYLIEELPPPKTFQPYQIIDMGKLLSEKYEKDKINFNKQIEFDSAEYIVSLVDSKIDNSIPRVIFSNFGIFKESAFHLNIQKFFLSYTKSNNVFLYWPYIIKNMETLCWSDSISNENSIRFDRNILQKAVI